MGEWSDYFEDFPEENPANYINDCYINPNGVEAYKLKAHSDAELKRSREQAALDAEIKAIIQKHGKKNS
ncbi:MAG: hypothetical protein Q8Q54_01995 [Methylococcales bacterium]|nr:hypothetical protein [Methylococcales bacterium]